jgi:CHAT domain-containing protein/Tfp pilus assembly protein PilF
MRRRSRTLLLLAVWGGVSVFLHCRPAEPELHPGRALERSLPPGATQAYRLRLRAGEYAHLIVEQQGVDLIVTLRDPAGRTLLVVDSPNGTAGPEPVFAVAEREGIYRLAVAAASPRGQGRYRVWIALRRPATAPDRQRAAAASAFSAGERWRLGVGENSLRRALDSYRAALAGWRALGEIDNAAPTSRRIGQTAFDLGDLPAAAASYELALALYRQLGDPEAQVRLLNDLGVTERWLGAPQRAQACYRQALELAHGRRNLPGEATALHNLGLLAQAQGRLHESIVLDRQALALWERTGQRRLEAARTLLNLGTSYSQLGRLEEARGLLEQARDQLRATGDRRGETAALAALGWVDTLAGAPGAALPLYDQALALARATGDRRGVAEGLDRRGTALWKLGRTAEAATAYRRALALVLALGDRQSEAHTRTNLGWLADARGDPQGALPDLEQALRLFRQIGDRHGEAAALLGNARALYHLGRPAAAEEESDAALHLVETLRTEASSPQLRTSYLATRHGYYELAIDLRMARERETPGRGFAARALELSERARARSLLETIQELDGLRPSRPPRRALFAPLDAEALRSRLLDADTLLLEYALGEERSFVWVVGRRSLTCRELPPRSAIEALARQVQTLLSRSHQASVERQAQLVAQALARQILAPVADLLGRKRLLIAADGALLGVPFAALPDPASGGTPAPLLAAHEIVALPSASVAVLLHEQRTRRRPAPGLVAVLADPAAAPGEHRPGVRPAALTAGLPRLPYARREAAAILRLVPPARRFAALGPKASRETVLSGRLARYRIVHFATHARIDSRHPELSGIALSSRDERGQPRDGLLRTPEIYGLDLPADLVVLSACRTALGQEVRGEGLVGLTQVFFQAGAARVLVSLWSVDDEATAELMARFYDALLKRHLPPAAALRDAQLALRREPRWQAPAHWAGFELQGDWR